MLDPNEWTTVLSMAIVRREDQYRVEVPMSLVGSGGQRMTVHARLFNNAGPELPQAVYAPGETERQTRAMVDNMFVAAEGIEVGRRGPETTAAVAIAGSRSIGPEPRTLLEVWAD